MRRFLRSATVAAVLAFSACGSPSAGIPQPSQTPAPPTSGVLVSRADDRGTVRARVGDRVQIALGTEFEWRVDPPDGAVLRSGVQNALLPRGTQALWTAAGAGTSAVTATGTVICPSGKACIQLAVLFTATVIVDP